MKIRQNYNQYIGIEIFAIVFFAISDICKNSLTNKFQSTASFTLYKSNLWSFQVDKDDGIRENTTMERLAKLRPAFVPDGSTTAGN